MVMILTMVSYHHHEAPRAVRGSVGGCSMDMWCPYGIGRESWDREVLRLVDPDPSPLKGEISLAGVCSLRGCRRIGSHRIIVVVVVEYNCFLINNYCCCNWIPGAPNVSNSFARMLGFFKNFIFTPWSDDPANRGSCCCAFFLIACRAEPDFCHLTFKSRRGRCQDS